MLEDMKGLLQAAEDKRQASIAELSAKHQKVYLAFRYLKHGPYCFIWDTVVFLSL